MSTALLLWGVYSCRLVSSVGLGLFLYGKKQKAVVPLVCGIGLMVIPYFISNTALLVGAGATLASIPYFISL